MIAVSDRFLAAIRETHTVAQRATLYRPSDPDTPIEARMIGGTLSCDVDARSRRQANLGVAFSLADPDTPDVVRELAFGGQAVIERGVAYADGTEELVQLGRFRIDAVSWDEIQGEATLNLSDRMAQVSDEPLLQPWTPAGLKPSDAAVAAVQDVFGTTIAYHVLTDPASESALVDTTFDEDRASAVGSLAASVGAEAFFDNLGDFVIRPRELAAGATPVWTLDAGEHGALVATQESLDRSSVKNGVALRGQPSAELPPLFSLAVDDDPASPTRWGGPFGKVALIASSSAVQTQAQADATAAGLLNLRLGLTRTLVLRGIPNPALEPGDLIGVVHPDERTEEQVVNSLALDLGVDGQLELGTKASYRPAALRLQPQRVRIYTGATAWRELATAAVEEDAA
jgi:Domain of unknown function (DUF5047)